MQKPLLSVLVSVLLFFVGFSVFGASDTHAATYTAERGCAGVSGILFKEFNLPTNSRSEGTADGKAFAGRSSTPQPHVSMTLTDKGKTTIPVYVTYYNLTTNAYIQYSAYTVTIKQCNSNSTITQTPTPLPTQVPISTVTPTPTNSPINTTAPTKTPTPIPSKTPIPSPTISTAPSSGTGGEIGAEANREPAFPSCPAGSVKLKDFGPYQMHNKHYPTWPVYNLFDVTFNNSSGYTSGKIIVWQGEGHNWDLGCKAGPANDLNGVPSWSCDDVEQNEIATFTMNGTNIGEFIDHNPDDDRNFLWSFNASNLTSGTNTLRIQHKYPDRTDVAQSYVFVKGAICATSSQILTSPTPQNICVKKITGDSNCDGTLNLSDIEIWRREFNSLLNSKTSDFNFDSSINLLDFEIWRTNVQLI